MQNQAEMKIEREDERADALSGEDKAKRVKTNVPVRYHTKMKAKREKTNVPVRYHTKMKAKREKTNVPVRYQTKAK